MKSIAKMYTDAMRVKYGQVYATWKLGNEFALGDYGVLEDCVFTRHGNIKQLGADFKFTEIIDTTPSDEGFMSSTIKSNKITADGKIIPTESTQVAAGFSFEFTEAGTVVYDALNVRTNKINDVAALGAKIKKLFLSGEPAKNDVLWEKQFVVITEIDVVESASIIVSNNKGAKINCLAQANIGIGNLRLADPKFNWDFNSEKGIESIMNAKSGATPLFRLMGLKHRFSLIGNKPPVWKHAFKPEYEQNCVVIQDVDFLPIENYENWTGIEGFDKGISESLRLYLKDKEIPTNTTD